MILILPITETSGFLHRQTRRDPAKPICEQNSAKQPTMFFSKKSASQQAFSRETNELKRQIELSKTAILSAQNQFEQVVDPTLVDCYIYELNAAQLRYQFLLRRLKKRELQEV